MSSHSVTARLRPKAVLVLGCFHGTADGSALARGAGLRQGGVRIDDRAALVRTVEAQQPQVILLPPVDAEGVSTAPLISRLREVSPAATILISLRESGQMTGVAEALRAGAQPLLWSTSAELNKRLEQHLLASTEIQVPSVESFYALLADLPSAKLRTIISSCAILPPERLTIEALADKAGTSRRTFARVCLRRNWPPPSELLAWTRLLRASMIRLAGTVDSSAIALASGFRNARSLRRACLRYVDSAWVRHHGLAPLGVVQALRRRCDVLARAL